MLVRIKKSGPGCVYRPGSLLRIPDKRAKNLIRDGWAVPCDVMVDLEDIQRSIHYPLVGENITSIIIPVYNQPEYLEKCLKSVIKHTNSPYEIIVVDNGSDRKTKKVIKSFKVRVITNETNLGFPKSVNQGILNSRGNKICLLNSDTIVTPNWLKEMTKALDGKTGLVGPTTNYSSGLQCVRSLSTVGEFRKIQTGRSNDWPMDKILSTAGKFQLNRGEYKRVGDLSGFCLLIDRRVISEIGGFDLVFGLGSAEEKDFEDRARRAGWNMVWAKGSYVHHHGHKTLRGVYNADDGLGARGKINHQIYLERVTARDNDKLGIVVPFFDKIPIMYPTWGRLGYTKKSLPNLIEKSPLAQIVIFDDGSTDGTIEWLAGLNIPQIVGQIYRGKRVGLDRQIDLFFSLCAGVNWVGKIDNDTIVPDYWMEELIEAAEKSNVDIIAPSHFKNVMAKKKYLSPSKEIERTGVFANRHVGGLFLLRGSWLESALKRGQTAYWEQYGKTPGGWTNLQETSPGIKAFYPKVYAVLLDLGDGKNDYPEYNAKLIKERRIAYGRIPEEQ